MKRDPVTQYAERVLSGKIIAGPWVRAACERHLRDLSTAKKRGLVWRADIAQRVIDFFSCLRFTDGRFAGEPFVLSPWQQFIQGSIFGWLRSDGLRRFRNAYIEVGKGNGKTPLAAGTGIYGLVADGETSAEIYAAAVTRDQARILFRDATLFVESSPSLRKRVTRHRSNLSYPHTWSHFRPVSSEGRSLDGLRVHMALIDELHEHPNSEVVDKLRAGTKGRPQALIYEITNSGYDRESVCYLHHDYSIKILRGIMDNDSWFAYVCALDDGDDPLNDESCWIKANPNLGVSITEQYLREQVEEAIAIPQKRNTVLRLNFCVWTEQAHTWMPMESWDRCNEPFSEDDLLGRPCYAGLDLSYKYDVSACVYVFPPTHDKERWKIVPRFFVPEDDIMKRVRRDRVPYDLWRDQGAIIVTPGSVIDYDFIREQINEDGKKFVIKEIAYDAWGATQIAQQLSGDGFVMVPFGQGYRSMSEPMKELQAMVVGEKISHAGNPVLRWMASNMSASQDPAGNVKPDKAKSADRIDGMVALIMALGRAIVMNTESNTQEVGIVVL